ncbi:MAG: class I SAM-dependent methyltransferase [Candidatus Heimdallarchaeota archaeon]
MQSYYSEKLSAQRLKRCYEIVPRRVQQYLDAEIQFVLKQLSRSFKVLELGCGYGRVLQKLVPETKEVIGIDTSRASLELAKTLLMGLPNVELLQQNAVSLGFQRECFDVVIAIQNGLSAFKVDQHELLKESLRVTRDGGNVVLSSYSENFWDERLEWFELQAKEGLLGEIDWEETRNGTIVCKDGFRATTVSPTDFALLAADLHVQASIEEVDNSSIFCTITASHS